MLAVSAKKSCAKCRIEVEADAQFCPVDGTELTAVDPYIGQVIAGDIDRTAVLGRHRLLIERSPRNGRGLDTLLVQHLSVFAPPQGIS